MANIDHPAQKTADLRRRAEALAGDPPGTQAGMPLLSPEETWKMVHGLQVHQIELEMQNEELLRVQAELDATRSRYLDIYDLAPVGYCTLSRRGVILEANLTAASMMGVPRGALLMEPLTRYVFKDDQDIYYLHRKELLESGAGQRFELRLLRKDAPPFWASLGATIALAADGAPLHLVVLTDISERKRAEEEGHALQGQLQQSQKMESLGILAGGVAHDMNNVLTAILGLASVHLQLAPEGSPARAAFATISEAALRGGKMVKSLLNFARKSPVEERTLDLNTLLLEEVGLLERTTLSKVKLDLDLEPELRSIRGDGGALSHAFMNLCVNAVDAMPGNGRLTLRSRNVDDHWVEVLVEDNGSGMSKEVLDRALDPFFTTKDIGKGTGLGLSQVYSTVKAHKGQVDLQSEPGRGTQVRLRFPVSRAPEPPTPVLAPPSCPRAPVPLNVLLVDDDDLVLRSARTLIATLGHMPTIVTSGEEALAKIEAGLRPDLVVLDLNMPGLGGAGTLPRLRVLCPTVPVVLCTGRADDAALDLIAAHPKVTLLCKPYTLEDLQKVLALAGTMPG